MIVIISSKIYIKGQLNMYKKRFILLTSLVLLTACNTNEPEEVDNSNLDETIEESVEDENVGEAKEESDVPTEDINENADNGEENNDIHNFDGLVDEATFTNEYGLQAWEDYQVLIEDISLGDNSIMNEENPDYTLIEGASSSELEERFASMDVREDVHQDEVEISDIQWMSFHRYPPEADSDYEEIADFLAEISLYYVDDNLMFTAITPGYYEVEIDTLPDAQTLASLFTVSEIEDINPKIFTIAQMNINGSNIQQVMTPAMNIDEAGNEEIVAFYFFTDGEDIIQYAFLPFEMVSIDFPTNSILLYQQIIPELESL